MSTRSQDVYLFRMFFDHDETGGTSVSCDFSNPCIFKQESNFFVYDRGTHYSNCHSVTIRNKLDSVRG